MTAIRCVVLLVFVLGCGQQEQFMRVGGEVKPPAMLRRAEPDFSACEKQRVPIPFIIIETTIDRHGKVGPLKFLKPTPPCAQQAVTQALAKHNGSPRLIAANPCQSSIT